jgi:hypothetical protein
MAKGAYIKQQNSDQSEAYDMNASDANVSDMSCEKNNIPR